MKILILGGTNFVGRHTAELAQTRGHDVTVLSRGNKSAPSGAKAIVGDRLTSSGYSGLTSLTFDAVIDTWSGDPSAVQSAVEALRGRIKLYVYISSISIYNFGAASGPYTESTPRLGVDETEIKYIKNKVGGEIFASQSGVPTALIRPGVILGPYEDVWRLPWWLQRMTRGGPTLAPAPKAAGLQFIDVRDLASFTIHVVEQKLSGSFNALSEMNHVSMGEFLDAANHVAGGQAELHWLEPAKLSEAGIREFVDLPMWLTKDKGVYSMDVRKSFDAGLTIRPAKETIEDTWTWLQTLDDSDERQQGAKVGLSRGKQAELLRTLG